MAGLLNLIRSTRHRVGRQEYLDIVAGIRPTALVGYWPMLESSGTVAYDYSRQANNGVYTGVEFGHVCACSWRLAPLFDGVNDYVNLYSAALNADFNGQEGSVFLWARAANTGVWTDGNNRRLIIFAVDTNNQFVIRKAGNNAIGCFYTAGGVAETVALPAVFNNTEPFAIGMTWSRSADQMKAYHSGVQAGATQTGLGAWTGALSTTGVVIGAASTAPANVWSGTIAHVAVWNEPLTATEMALLYFYLQR